MMRMPLWRLPLMEPPRASTMKLTRNLHKEKKLPFQRWQGSGELKSKTTMDTREEDDSHAVITVHPNKEEIEIKKRRARDKTRD